MRLSGRKRTDGQRMHAPLELGGQNRIDHAVPLDPALSLERLCRDMHVEVRLPPRPVPCMTFMQMRFVPHLELHGRESLGQFIDDQIAGAHVLRIVLPLGSVNSPGEEGFRRCQLLRRIPHSAHIERS